MFNLINQVKFKTVLSFYFICRRYVIQYSKPSKCAFGGFLFLQIVLIYKMIFFMLKVDLGSSFKIRIINPKREFQKYFTS